MSLTLYILATGPLLVTVAVAWLTKSPIADNQTLVVTGPGRSATTDLLPNELEVVTTSGPTESGGAEHQQEEADEVLQGAGL